MIQFFVNFKTTPSEPEWHEILLPDDYSFTETEENPEITTDGEYTLDITVSLLEAKNIIAFSFMNRQNKTDISKTADAKSIDNGKVRSGTIIITNNTDIDVTFQFIAGNSELKYIAKNELKIWFLDWGTETAIDFDRALKTTSLLGYGNYPGYHGEADYMNNFVCTPVLVAGKVYNEYTFNEGNLNIPSTINGINGLMMQPYLLYYINKLPSLLGYTLKHNVINDDPRAKVMYLLNSVDSLNYADALPDMTVTEFQQAIEEFFNVEFLVDSKDKSISIENQSSNLANKKTVNAELVLDPYKRDFSQDSKAVRLDFTRIKYDVADTTYFKYQQLSDDAIAKCKIIEFENFAALSTFIKVSGEFTDQLYIYRDKALKNDYFFGTPTVNLYSIPMNSLTQYVNLINKFSPYGDVIDRVLELKIVPAEVTVEKRTVKWYTTTGAENTNEVAYQLPKCSNSYFIGDKQGFVDTVENGIKSVSRGNKLEVALYTGKIKMLNTAWTMAGKVDLIYPFSHVDFYSEFGAYGTSAVRFSDFETWKNTYFTPVATETMRLNGIGGVVADYQQKVIIDTTKEYNFTLVDGPDINANNLFMINNLKYMPISLDRERTRTQKTVLAKCYIMLD